MIDIESNIDIFFEAFSIKPVEINLHKFEQLKALLCDKGFEYEEELDGVTYKMFDQYSLIYCSDQWWECSLVKMITFTNDKITYKIIGRGQGDSPLLALLGLYVDIKHMLNIEELTILKGILEE